MKYYIETYGCQLNVAESDAIELILKGLSVEKCENPIDADFIIINTCSVRASAENRVWGRLGFFSSLKREKGSLKIIFTGCMASRIADELKKKAPFIDYIISNNEKGEIPFIIEGGKEEKRESYSFLSSYYKEGSFSSYVPIMNGCNNFCSYCIVPYVRGREVSRPVSEIINEVKHLGSSGVKEITLLGQNVNSYSRTDEDGVSIDFPTLLERILPHLGSIEYVRFESPHPKDFSDRLISVMASSEKIARHIHLPLQSGSSRILKLMNRKYDRESFMFLVDKIRKGLPDVTFSTDVMVGFPTETEEEYQETISMMDYMETVEAFMYYFNPREGTKAFSMDGQIPLEEKTRRLEELINKQLDRARRIKESLLPFTSKAIVLGRTRDDERKFLARNEHNYMISFEPKKEHGEGDIVDLLFQSLKGNTFTGVEL